MKFIVSLLATGLLATSASAEYVTRAVFYGAVEAAALDRCPVSVARVDVLFDGFWGIFIDADHDPYFFGPSAGTEFDGWPHSQAELTTGAYVMVAATFVGEYIAFATRLGDLELGPIDFQDPRLAVSLDKGEALMDALICVRPTFDDLDFLTDERRDNLLEGISALTCNNGLDRIRQTIIKARAETLTFEEFELLNDNLFSCEESQ